MNNDLLKVLSETIEHGGQVCKLFVASEIALNDGDMELSIKYNEILKQEGEMNLLKPYSEKLPTYNEFKASLTDLNNFKQDEKNNKEIITKIEGYKSIIESEKGNHERFVSLEGETKALNNKKVELSAELKRLDELEKEKNTL